MIAEAGRTRRLLAYPFHDWRKLQAEGFRTRDGHVLEALAKRSDVERILVVDRPSSVPERVARRGSGRVRGAIVAAWADGRASVSITAVAERVDVLDVRLPDVVGPVRDRRGWWFDAFLRPAMRRAIERGVSERLGPPTDVLMWVPTVAPVAFVAGGRTVFDSLDNWLIHPQLRRHADDAEAAYAEILPRVDAAFASGPASAAVLRRWRPDVAVLPNGVDPDIFAGSFDRPPDLPSGPVVGYAGKLAERIDEDLVIETASRLSDVQFVFVGPVLRAGAVRRMAKAPNVLLLGDRPYERVPAYLHAFDIAWIPHRVGEGETGGDPIKLYEYWAAGRQVVTTRIDGSDEWGPQCHVVDNGEQASKAISGLLDRSIPPLPTVVPGGRVWDRIAAALLGTEY